MSLGNPELDIKRLQITSKCTNNYKDKFFNFEQNSKT